jgi:hypothetical protein
MYEVHERHVIVYWPYQLIAVYLVTIRRATARGIEIVSSWICRKDAEEDCARLNLVQNENP